MQNFFKTILQYIALASFAVSLTILFLGMRSVMGIGGFCAEGGPYEIAVHCPKGIAGMIPLSIFGMLISGAVYMFSHKENTPNFTFLFWTSLFGALGYNFLEFAFYPPDNSGLVISWVVCGVMFELMAIGPLFLLRNEEVMSQMFSPFKKGSEPTSALTGSSKLLLLLLSLAAAGAGIYFGIFIFNYFSA